jgi:DEAD/DEAH box helicase domain-containing protein
MSGAPSILQPQAAPSFDPVSTFLGTLSPTVIETVEVETRLPRFAELPEAYRSGAAALAMASVHPPGGKLWHHQALALDLVDAGENVLVTTATGSGKSLVFHYPVLREMVGGDGTAIILYPQKALGSDQLGRWRQELAAMDLDPALVAEINGQVPMCERGEILKRARILLMTPDVVHAWFLRLRATEDVQNCLRRLRFLVIDEAHLLDGVFGSNCVYFFRRLRFAAMHAKGNGGGALQLIAASATIGDPLRHVEDLTGCRFAHVSEDDNGAPTQPMTLLHIEGADRGRTAETALADAIAKLIPEMAGESLLAFADSRQGVERISKLTDDDRVLPYRNGLDRTDLCEIEGGLKNGDLMAAACTSAFEVGIDIDRFRIGLNLGVPPTRRSLRQRAGRIGRSKPGLFAVIAPRAAFTKLGTTFAEAVTGPVEPNHLHLGNRIIQYQQACCLRAELGDAETLIEEALQVLDWPAGFAEAVGWTAPLASRPSDIDGVARLMGECPHFDFPLRQIADVSFKLRMANDLGVTLGDISIEKAMREAYPGATYLHRRRSYRVVGWRRSAFEHSILLKQEKGRIITTPLLKSTASASLNAEGIFDRHNLVSDQGVFAECRLKVSEAVFGYTYGGKKMLYSELAPKNAHMRQQRRDFETTGVLIRIDEPWFRGAAPREVNIRKRVAEALKAILLSEQGIPAGEIDYAHTGIDIVACDGPQKLDNAIVIFDDVPGGLRLTQPLFEDFDAILDRLDRGAGMAGEDSLLEPPIIERLRDWYGSLTPSEAPETGTSTDRLFAPGSMVGVSIHGEMRMRKLLGHQFVNLDGTDRLMYNYEVEGGTALVSATAIRPVGSDWRFLPDAGVNLGGAQ